MFKIYDAAAGGSLVWTSQAQNALVAGGVFSVVLETGTPVNLSTAVFAGARYIEVAVGGLTLSPRQELLSAPYALVAQALSSDARVNPSSLDAGGLGANVIASSIAVNAVYSNSLNNGVVTFVKMAGNGCAGNEIMKRDPGNTAWICAPDAGAGSGITLGAPFPDSDVSVNDSIYLNDTGGGNLLRLQTGGVNKFVVDGTGLLLTGSVGAASIAGGSLLNTVIASSLAVNSVYDGAIISMASSKLTGALPAISGAALTNINSAQFAQVASDTTTLKAGIDSVAVDTGTLYGRLAAVATDTTTLKTGLDLKATDSLALHLAGVETITGVKTFSADPVFTNDNAIPQAKVNGLTAALAAKAGTGANTFTGVQTFGAGASIAADAAADGVAITTAVFIGAGANVSSITAAGFAGSGGGLLNISSIAVNALNHSGQIADGTIIADDIADSTISLNKLNGSGCSTGQVPQWNGSAWGCAAAGTDSLGNHIATTTLSMSGFDVVGVSTLTVSSITTAGSGVVFSTNVYFMNGNVGIGTANPAQRLEVNGTFSALVPINSQTGTAYTLAASDNNKLVTLDNAGAIAVTIPANASVSIPIGFQCTLVQKNAGTVTLSKAGGVTVISTALALAFNSMGSACTLVKVGADEWLAYGDMN